jgi:hypothetical protein
VSLDIIDKEKIINYIFCIRHTHSQSINYGAPSSPQTGTAGQSGRGTSVVSAIN